MQQLLLEGVADQENFFRPIHYLGSKLRLLPVIRAAIRTVASSGAICDLFSGSGTVALTLGYSWPVVCVDIQEYSRVLCSALLSTSPENKDVAFRAMTVAEPPAVYSDLLEALEPVSKYESECILSALEGNTEPLCDFIEHGSLALFAENGSASARAELRRRLRLTVRNMEARGLMGADSLVTRHFGGAYFSFAQAAALDGLLHMASIVQPSARDAAVASVLSTASEVVNTIGKHFAQPIRPRDGKGIPKKNLVSRVIKDRAVDVFSTHSMFAKIYRSLCPNAGAHTVVKDDYNNFLGNYAGPIGAFYADPPYTRDHYSRFYHVLETMCLRDEPEISRSYARNGIASISRGLYRSDRHQSPFCIKSQAPKAFSDLFEGTRRFNVPLVVSYSPFESGTSARPRLMGIDRITALAKRHFRKVSVKSVGQFSHSKLNAQDKNAPINRYAEVLIICQP